MRSPAAFAFGAGGNPLWRAVCLAAVVFGVCYASHDRTRESVLAVSDYAHRRMWREALAAGGGAPLDPATASAVTRTSFHAGLLSNQLPPVRSPDELLLLGRERIGDWERGELYLDLGFVNGAIHHLTEAVEFWGERPALLERLVILNLAVENTDTARIYLNALTRVPFHAAWAHDYLRRLASDPSLAGDPEVARLRSLAVRQDTVAHPGVESQLLLLMSANSSNRMAFEYLMTYYLLTKNLGGFARRVPHITDFPGGELSPLWQEALVLWRRSQGASQTPLVFPGSADCQRRLDHFIEVIKACGGNKEAAGGRLRNDYGSSYFFYYFFHR